MYQYNEVPVIEYTIGNRLPEVDAPFFKDWDEYFYICGVIPPNYPMPAIITETSIWRNCIMFFKDLDTEPFKMWVGN